MGKPNRTIIADASGLISLTVTTDSNHGVAKTYIEALLPDKAIVVPTEIFAETVNLLGKKFGHGKAIEAVQILADFAWFTIEPTSDLVRDRALEIFEDVGQDVSYTDCLVMAMAEQHGTIDIFGFDEIFFKRGFSLPTAQRQAA
jgi:predicted nucleic acid-binding protein